MKLVRSPIFRADKIGVIDKNRDSTRNPLAAKAVKKISAVGRGTRAPRVTKNKVMKKSRRLTILAITSRLYGNVDNDTPAMSAPISRESPSHNASMETLKHHAKAPISISSGIFAIERNNTGNP